MLGTLGGAMMPRRERLSASSLRTSAPSSMIPAIPEQCLPRVLGLEQIENLLEASDLVLRFRPVALDCLAQVVVDAALASSAERSGAVSRVIKSRTSSNSALCRVLVQPSISPYRWARNAPMFDSRVHAPFQSRLPTSRADGAV